VYYKDNTLSSWVAYNTNLPRVVVAELEIQNSSSKLRAATYGRGIWQSDLMTPVAVEESILTETLNLFPNPSQGIINIETGNSAGINSLVVFDVVGKAVKDFVLPAGSANNIRLDVSDLPSGIYSVQLNGKSGVRVSKFSLVR
jgi:hypothetical protein